MSKSELNPEDVPDTERRERYAAAIFGAASTADDRAYADAAMAVATRYRTGAKKLPTPSGGGD